MSIRTRTIIPETAHPPPKLPAYRKPTLLTSVFLAKPSRRGLWLRISQGLISHGAERVAGGDFWVGWVVNVLSSRLVEMCGIQTRPVSCYERVRNPASQCEILSRLSRHPLCRIWNVCVEWGLCFFVYFCR